MVNENPDYWAAPDSIPRKKVPICGERPGVWTWYVVYCVVMAMLYLLCLLGGLALLVLPIPFEDEEERVARLVGAVVIAVLGAILFAVYAAAPFLPKRRWSWIY